MSEPLWCEIRQHYCRCHDFGRRCDDYDEVRDQLDSAALKFMDDMDDSSSAAESESSKEK